MVRPAHFAFNEQTAESNSFQNAPEDISGMQTKVLAEFDSAVATLRDVGVDVWVIEDTDNVIKPDAIFPNNWISTHEDGTVVLYPMLTPNRRAERRMDIVESLKENFEVSRILDLSSYEGTNEFLEGTGSVVFDHEACLAYACLSPRTHLSVLQHLCDEIGYKPVVFHSVDEQGQDVYHTNVVMGIAKEFVVICLESVRDEQERALLAKSIETSGKEIIDISFNQVKCFAGNVLAVNNELGENYLALSVTAYSSLSEGQKERISRHAAFLPISIPTIETIGGGGVRCMLAQNFLKITSKGRKS
ncbi:MAG: arginine deiminase-related protein [Bacteroidota bacterium]